MDYLIIFITTATGLYFHGWLYVRIRRWMDRDLALSLAGKDEGKRAFMLERLADARAQKIKRRSGLRPQRQAISLGRLLRAPDVQESSGRPADDSSGDHADGSDGPARTRRARAAGGNHPNVPDSRAGYR